MRDEPAMTFQEIADALGLELREVRADYTRAIRKLSRNRVLETLKSELGDQRQVIYPEW